jgi:ligand-binding SRPBCC domain-containing protein
MTCIELITSIHASATTCFNASLSVDLHIGSMKKSGEKVIRGKTSGQFALNDVVTWEARHFGIRQQLTVQITKTEPYTFFEDRMLKGAFKSMVHKHYFEEKEGVTLMRDEFCYEVPLGILGALVDGLVLKSYMTKLLKTRNNYLKHILENPTNTF